MNNLINTLVSVLACTAIKKQHPPRGTSGWWCRPNCWARRLIKTGAHLVLWIILEKFMYVLRPWKYEPIVESWFEVRSSFASQKLNTLRWWMALVKIWNANSERGQLVRGDSLRRAFTIHQAILSHIAFTFQRNSFSLQSTRLYSELRYSEGSNAL